MDIKVLPGKLAGAVAAPPSKSAAHRAIIAAALAEFDLHPSIYIVKTEIELPQDRSKYKRFECINECIDIKERVESRNEKS